MKKTILTLGLAGIALIALFAACNKENSPSQKVSVPALYAYEAASKTTLGADWSVAWNENDKLTVFNVASGGSTFSDNCKFLINGTPSEGKFVKDATETDKNLISGESAYDWYVCSPWSQYCQTPGTTKGYGIATAPRQVGYNSNAHIASSDLMAGVAYGVADGTAPSVALHHVGSLMKFTITNNSGKAAAITGLSLDATDGGSYITGGFTMNWGNASTAPSLSTEGMSNKKYTCDLSVERNAGTEDAPDYVTMDETIANGASVDLYMMVAPFSIAAGKKIKLIISGSLGSVTLEKTFSSGITFSAGTYNTASLSYEPETDPEGMVFKETFGTSFTGNLSNYSSNKSGLTTANPDDASGYAYGGTATIQTTDKINFTSYGEYLEGGVGRFATATSAANSLYITGVKVKANTTYIFKYNKSKGMKTDGTEFDTETRVRWRKNGATSWPTTDPYIINPTTAVGTISQELSFGEETTIDIGVFGDKNPVSVSSLTYCPAVDLFMLIEKQ